MRQLQLWTFLVSISLLTACADNAGISAWNQTSNQAQSSGAKATILSVALATSGDVPASGIAENLTATISGGTAPYKLNFSYTSNGTSSCPKTLGRWLHS